MSTVGNSDVITTVDNAGNVIPAIQTYPVDIDDELLGQRVVLYVEGLKDLAPNARLH